MNKMTVTEFADLTPAQLRLAETKHLFELFKNARNTEPNHGLFLLTTYFDSLLFCLVSIEEMVIPDRREKLRSINSFLFFKALRNVATHHCVLSGIKGKFERPIARVVSVVPPVSGGFSEQFYLLPDKLESIFDVVLAERHSQKRTIDGARSFLSLLRASGARILIADVVQAVIDDVEPLVA